MKRLITAMCFVFVLAGVHAAQTPSQTPQPGPEHKRLQYYVGTWTSEFEYKPGPMGPGGKMTGIDQNVMMPGGFFMVSSIERKGSMGELKELAITGYDLERKVYTYDDFSNDGHAGHAFGTVQGDTWIWTAESKFGGKPATMRLTVKEVSPTLYTMKLAIATDSVDWTTVMEGH